MIHIRSAKPTRVPYALNLTRNRIAFMEASCCFPHMVNDIALMSRHPTGTRRRLFRALPARCSRSPSPVVLQEVPLPAPGETRSLTTALLRLNECHLRTTYLPHVCSSTGYVRDLWQVHFAAHAVSLYGLQHPLDDSDSIPHGKRQE